MCIKYLGISLPYFSFSVQSFLLWKYFLLDFLYSRVFPPQKYKSFSFSFFAYCHALVFPFFHISSFLCFYYLLSAFKSLLDYVKVLCWKSLIHFFEKLSTNCFSFVVFPPEMVFLDDLV